MDETNYTPPGPPPGPPPFEPPPPPSAPPPAVIPWEDPARAWPGALVETVRLLLSQPRRTFERVPVHGDVLRPVLFALALGWFGLVLGALWEMTVGDAMRKMMPATPGNPYAGLGPPRAFFLALIPLGPIFVAVGLIINAALVHVGLLLVGGARNGFVATLRAISYSYAPNVGYVLPLCGGFLVSVGLIILMVIGLSTLHRITIGKAIIGLLIPLVVCCGCGIVGAVMFGAAIMSGMKGMTP